MGLLALSIGPATRGVDAQYFGRNRVRYRTFDFQVLKTRHFDIYYYPEEAEGAVLAARMAERWYARLSTLLSHELARRQPVVLYAGHPHFLQTTALLGGVGEGVEGATEPLKRRVVLPFAGPLAETDHVLGHELVHAFQFDMTSRSGSAFAPPTATQMPLWFIEGMAEYLSQGSDDAHTAMWMRDAARTKKLPTIRQLEDPRYFPYRYGQALWAYIAGRWGDRVVGEIMRRSASTGAVIPMMAAALGTAPDSLVLKWAATTEQAYAAIAESTRAPADFGRPVIAAPETETGRRGGGLNIGPALSPDGKRLVFLSERSRVSIEMYLADVQTGKVQRKIVKTALDQHYESLQFINSAGAWHPDGHRFAFAGVSKGRPVLSVIDVDRGKIDREFVIREAAEVFSPTWSPDGTRMAFSGWVGGLSDLFVLDVGTGAVTRLTHDPYADLEPAWSPDGRSIAFVTDRFTTDLATLAYGAYRLALIDPAGQEIRPLKSFPGAKHINPQWAPDGGSLYFLSDRNGISNIYRLELGTGDMRQLTNVLTGVSGITALSPALSVALNAPRLVFSAYEKGKYSLYAQDSAAFGAGAGQPPVPLAAVSPALLPPVDRTRGDLDSLLSDARSGLPPADTSFPSAKYRARFSLDFVSPLNVGVGSAGAFGTAIGGGSALFWGDMLGERSLSTTIQVNGGFADLAALVGYQNFRRRWTWGMFAGQSPFITFGFRRTGDVGSDSIVIDSLYRFRRTDRQVTGLLAYPFNRVQRIEFSAGYRSSSYDRQVVTRDIFPDSIPVRVHFHDPVDLPAPGSNGQIEGSVALVYDNALWGPASPALGQRYRLALSPSFGELNYYGVLFDYRRYIMPVRPYTIATRLLHYGRYGRNSDDERLIPVFLGFQTLIRGYTFRQSDLSGCPAIIQSAGDCAALRDLLGSRVAVGNVEFRVPLQGLGIEPPVGLPSIELAPFFDAGVAWLHGEQPKLFGGTRNLLTSYGLAIRANLFGALILEFDVVHPNNRPGGNRWFTQIGVQPGF
jgi:Tol biopolymer transport system component